MADQRKHNIHTTPNPDGGWDNQTGGGKLSHHRTKEEAEQPAVRKRRKPVPS
ncbi:DUF2188 domain-containing protein [Paenibacillus sp. DMB5]|uniref:DUF2188 domain-containing protein n=1 Tax=Paenibacillus sp. DMB5 TaxID=1780103 RepID=UPI002696D744